MWKPPKHQRLPEVLQCSVDPINKHLHWDWLVWTRQNKTRAGFCQKITRGLGEPSLIESRGSGILHSANQCAQTGIVRRAQNFLRESVRKGGDLASGASEPVIRHRPSQAKAILNDVQAVHVIGSRFHPPS